MMKLLKALLGFLLAIALYLVGGYVREYFAKPKIEIK